jgi:hypothetical protein
MKHKQLSVKIVRLWFISIVFSMFLIGPTFGQNASVTLDVKSLTLKEVFAEIENQTGYSFLYSNTSIDVNQRVSLSVSALPLENALEVVFIDKPISFSIEGRQIVLTAIRNNESQQQRVTVSGIVRDAQTVETLPGVNVMIKGTTQGTVTDFDGKFTIEVAEANPILIFSFVGYNSQEVSVTGKSSLSVFLEQEAKSLEEVVVIGYGSESKKLLTGSIGAISTEGMQERPIQSIDNVLQG